LKTQEEKKNPAAKGKPASMGGNPADSDREKRRKKGSIPLGDLRKRNRVYSSGFMCKPHSGVPEDVRSDVSNLKKTAHGRSRGAFHTEQREELPMGGEWNR